MEVFGSMGEATATTPAGFEESLSHLTRRAQALVVAGTSREAMLSLLHKENAGLNPQLSDDVVGRIAAFHDIVAPRRRGRTNKTSPTSGRANWIRAYLRRRGWPRPYPRSVPTEGPSGATYCCPQEAAVWEAHIQTPEGAPWRVPGPPNPGRRGHPVCLCVHCEWALDAKFARALEKLDSKMRLDEREDVTS